MRFFQSMFSILIQKNFLFIISFLIGSNLTLAQESETLKFYIDLPIAEYPYNFKSEFPTVSIEQSIRLSKSFYYALWHSAIW